MSKLIIWTSGRPAIDGYKKRDFLWSEPHNAFIFEGREFEDSEFNEAFDKAFKYNQDLMPRVRVVTEIPKPHIVLGGGATGYEPSPSLHFSPPPTTEEKTESAEVTADMAEEILARLRPDRLKKKPGPKMLEVA